MHATDGNTPSVGFSSLGRRSVEAPFDGDMLTRDAGTMPRREAEGKRGLTGIGHGARRPCQVQCV